MSNSGVGCIADYKFNPVTGKPCTTLISGQSRVPAATDLFQFTQRMERGARDGEVKMLQSFLTKLGFNPGPIDGVFGTKTETAVKKWQETYTSEILAPLKRTTGTGVFAQFSRNVANSILKAGTVTLL